MLIFYDFEVLKYDWLVVLISPDSKFKKTIINDIDKLIEFYNNYKNEIWVGYNSRGYDQYILKSILLGFDPFILSDFIINKKRKGWEFSRLFNTIQLYNFDIKTTFHSLKELEGFMGNDIRESSISFNIERKLTKNELNEIEKYCIHDVEQTIEVFINRKQEYDSQISLLKTFNLPMSFISKTKAQLSACILKAKRQNRNDEFDFIFPNTLVLKKYQKIKDWYLDINNHNYDNNLEIEISGIPHIFAYGGLHGAREKFKYDGIILNCDVSSMYPALMIEYDLLSRNVENKEKYIQIRDQRIQFKENKDAREAPLKIVLNSTFGASKDKYNQLYDARSANLVCIAGQLLLLDLIEKLENHWTLIQTNTDGLIGYVKSRLDIHKIKTIAAEWEKRTKLKLEWEYGTKIIQKDVNNYLFVTNTGKIKSKGAYIKELTRLDNNLSIVNKALINYFTKGISVETTILNCNDLIEYQLIKKISNKYEYAMLGDNKLDQKYLRIFASLKDSDEGIFKIKYLNNKESKHKIENTPYRCFIDNTNINNKKVPDFLDKEWYINLAKSRIEDFGG